MLIGILNFALSVSKNFCLIVELKSFTVHNGRIMNSLRPLGPMTDWVGGSALAIWSLESSFGLFTSTSPSISEESELDNGLHSSEEVPGSF